jgi:hypothetical protein
VLEAGGVPVAALLAEELELVALAGRPVLVVVGEVHPVFLLFQQ